jgi:peptidoglycan hydrolase-like protein with peptidoglycan-binding domain
MAEETVYEGSHGDAVKELQEKLAALAASTGNHQFDPGTPDGVFGHGTEAALKAFQEAHQLPADGVAGPHTWAALDGAAGGGGGAAPHADAAPTTGGAPHTDAAAHPGGAPHADAAHGSATLTWMHQPAVMNQRIHYSYTNSGKAAAAAIHEEILVDGQAAGSQSVESLAVGATHDGVVSSAVPDGKHHVSVRVHTSTDGTAWDPNPIEGTVEVTVTGGAVGAPAEATPTVITPHITGIEFDHFTVVVQYTVHSNEQLGALQMWAQCGPNGSDAYYSEGVNLPALEGSARLQLPDNCHGTSLAAQVLLRATSSKGTNFDTRAQVPVEVYGGAIVRTGDLAVLS